MLGTRCRRLSPAKMAAEPVPPVAYRLIRDVDSALEEQVLNVPQAQRILVANHHQQADDLGWGVKTVEGTWRLGSQIAAHCPKQ